MVYVNLSCFVSSAFYSCKSQYVFLCFFFGENWCCPYRIDCSKLVLRTILLEKRGAAELLLDTLEYPTTTCYHYISPPVMHMTGNKCEGKLVLETNLEQSNLNGQHQFSQKRGKNILKFTGMECRRNKGLVKVILLCC